MVDKEFHFSKGLTNRMKNDPFLVRTMNLEEALSFCQDLKKTISSRVMELFKDSEQNLFKSRSSRKGRKGSQQEDPVKGLSVDQMLQIMEVFAEDEIWFS